MSQVHYLTTPLTDEDVMNLKAGDIVYLSGHFLRPGMPHTNVLSI